MHPIVIIHLNPRFARMVRVNRFCNTFRRLENWMDRTRFLFLNQASFHVLFRIIYMQRSNRARAYLTIRILQMSILTVKTFRHNELRTGQFTTIISGQISKNRSGTRSNPTPKFDIRHLKNTHKKRERINQTRSMFLLLFCSNRSMS